MFKEVEGLIARQTRYKKQVLDIPSVIQTKKFSAEISKISPIQHLKFQPEISKIQPVKSHQEIPQIPEFQLPIAQAALKSTADSTADSKSPITKNLDSKSSLVQVNFTLTFVLVILNTFYYA